jgi:glycosyltransferase involved in cell wall biosynthesis
VHISGIVRAFEKMGHRVILSSPTGIDPRETAGSSPFVEPRSVSGSWAGLASLSRAFPRGLFEILEFLYNIPAFWRNLRLARRHGCGLIYERHAFFLFSTALVAGLCGCPLVVEVNELVGDSRIRAQPLFSALARWTDRFLFRRARLVVAVSPYLKRRIEQYGVPAARILVLPNGVAEEELATPPEPSTPLARVPPDCSFTLCFAGWLVEWHRLDFLIEALAVPEFAGVLLVLIGEGPLRSDLESRARALGVRLHCAGALAHSAVAGALRGMDACVVPHSNEYRSPIKLFEYMAQERPVLAPRTEPIESVLTDGKEGLLFAPLDVGSFRSSLRKILGSKELRESIGHAARLSVKEEHTWEHHARKILSQIG